MSDDWLNPNPETFRNFAQIWTEIQNAVGETGWCTFESNGTIAAESYATTQTKHGWRVEVGLTKVAMYVQQGDKPTIYINSGINDFPTQEAVKALQACESSGRDDA